MKDLIFLCRNTLILDIVPVAFTRACATWTRTGKGRAVRLGAAAVVGTAADLGAAAVVGTAADLGLVAVVEVIRATATATAARAAAGAVADIKAAEIP
jgi:hypothetical protein